MASDGGCSVDDMKITKALIEKLLSLNTLNIVDFIPSVCF